MGTKSVYASGDDHIEFFHPIGWRTFLFDEKIRQGAALICFGLWYFILTSFPTKNNY
jgi:hypothetical protein